MKKLLFTGFITIVFNAFVIAQCSCYTVEDLNLVGQDSMELVLSNSCDNNVYLNLYVISSLSPFDTLARQEIFNAFILPLNTNIPNILETNETELPTFGSYRISITNGTVLCDSLQFSSSLNSVQNQNLEKLTISPNPFNKDTHVQLEKHIDHATLSILDCNGKIVKEINNFSGQDFHLDLNNVSSGIYFLHVIQDHKLIAREQLVVQSK